MRIDKIDVYHIALPHKHENVLILGDERAETLETVLVRLTSDDAVGWGEVSPGRTPRQHAEWAGGVFRCLADCLAPAVLEHSSIDKGETLAEVLEPFQGNRHAKAALDLAWWDLKARMDGKPLHELLGGKHQAIPVGPCFDRMDSIDDLTAAVGQAFDDGFERVELKVRPGWDIQMLNAVRHECSGKIHIDIEGALTVGHTDILYRLDDFTLEMVEQPIMPEDLVGHAMLSESIRTPLCLDESLTSPSIAEMALDLKCATRFNIEPGKLGGLTAAIQVLDMCKGSDVGCWVGIRPQSTIGTRAALALAARTDLVYPSDYFPSGDLLEHDLAERLLPTRDGDGPMQIALWSEPGLGVVPDEELLTKCCVQQVGLQIA